MRRSEPRVFGREDDLALLDEYLDRVVAGQQQFVVIEGDPGMGKTALLQAFARRHTRFWRPRLRVFYLRAPEGARFEPVRHAALAATSRKSYARLGTQRQATEFARASAIDWLGAIPVWGNLLAAIVATAEAVRRWRSRAGPARRTAGDDDIEALLAAARRRPIVLLLDELDRADREAVRHLEALICTADEGDRILLVGAYRPTPAGVADPPVHSMLRRLPLSNETFAYRKLHPLLPEAVRAWVAARFRGSGPPQAFTDWLHAATGGHPGSIERTLEHLLERRAVRRAGRHWTFETDPDRLDLPPIGESFADLSAINPYLAEAIQAASALGEEFDSVTLSRVLDRDELAVEDQLALGVHFGLLRNCGVRPTSDGDVATIYRFAPHTRAALLRALPSDRRARLEEARRQCAPLPIPPT